MKLKNIEIVQLLNGINSLADAELPVRLAYAIKKNNRKLIEEYNDYAEQLKTLQDKYEDHKSEEYGKELRELLDIEVNIDFYKIGGEIFESSDFKITPKQIEIIDFMIE